MSVDDRPRSLRDPEVLKRRQAMLKEPHFAPLAAFAVKLREHDGAEVPDFDPLDGGVDARVLFLFEKPGPMTAVAGNRIGSGFISRNNNDATAAATHRFMEQAGIPRKLTVIWNAIPWWNGTRHVTARERREGNEAATAKSYFETTPVATLISSHPFPLVRARYRSRWEAIPSQWAEVMSLLGKSTLRWREMPRLC